MKKIVIYALIILALGYVYYTVINPPKKTMIKYLIENGYTTGIVNDLISFDNSFIKAWYKAAKNGAVSFTVNGAVYNIKGGKRLQ